MKYYITVLDGIHIVVVDNPHLFQVAEGRVFRNVLTNTFPKANGEFVIALEDEDNVLHFSSTTPVVNQQEISLIPETDWTDCEWGEDTNNSANPGPENTGPESEKEG